MVIRKDPQELLEKLEEVKILLYDITEDYIEDYADYGWDSFSECIATLVGTIQKEILEVRNARIRDGDMPTVELHFEGSKGE